MAQLIKRSRRKSPLKRKKSGKSGRKSGRKSSDGGVPDDYDIKLDDLTSDIVRSGGAADAVNELNDLKKCLIALRTSRNNLMDKISDYNMVQEFICRSLFPYSVNIRVEHGEYDDKAVYLDTTHGGVNDKNIYSWHEIVDVRL